MRFLKAMAVAVASLGLVGLAVTPAAAAPTPDRPLAAAAVVQPSPNTVGSKELKDDGVSLYDLADKSVWGVHIMDKTIGFVKLAPDARNAINSASNTANEALSKANEALAKPDKGDLTTFTVAPKKIEFIGGPYFDPARGFTLLGTFTLPAGKWLVNTSVKFTRTTAGTAGVRPQVGLRIGQDAALAGDAKWGMDVGTVGGEDISPVANKDLWGQAVSSVTLTSPTVVGVYGHGYTDTQGIEGSNEISAAVQVFAQRG